MNFGLANIGSEFFSFFVPKISGNLFPIPFAILTVWHSEHMFTGTYLVWDHLLSHPEHDILWISFFPSKTLSITEGICSDRSGSDEVCQWWCQLPYHYPNCNRKGRTFCCGRRENKSNISKWWFDLLNRVDSMQNCKC